MDFIRNLKLTINKLHVRLEDDILIPDRPYSLGLIINVSMNYFCNYHENSYKYKLLL